MLHLAHFLSVLACTLALCNVHAQQPVSSYADRVDHFVTHIADSLSIVGLSVGLVQHGEVVLAKGYGSISHAKTHPVDAHTAFLSCSITKLFTATAVMQLVEQGRLHLSDHVVDVLPGFKLRDKRYSEITVQHLLTHSSGLPWDHKLPNCPQDSTALDALVRSMANSVRLNFDPGSRSDGSTYSNAGYNLLGRIVEQVSGLSYERYVRIHLLGKVPMPDAAFDTTTYTGATWAHGVEVDGDTRAIQRFNLYGEEDPKHPIINGKPLSLRERRPHIAHEQNPCGGLWTSAADLSSWMAHLQCIAEDTLVAPTAPVLQRNTLLEMWRTQRSIPGKRTAIGLGWWNYNDPEQGRYVFHVGNDPGYSSILLMWPEFGVGVVILCNGMYADDGVWNVLGPGVARIVMGL